MKHLSKSLPVQRISPANEHFFFGYYDLQPYNQDESLYLAHKTTFRNRLHTAQDFAQIGVIDPKRQTFERLDTTFAWNFQQGAMLQWNPLNPRDEIIYNTMVDGEQRGVVMNIQTGRKRFLDLPVANVSKDGKYALAINMSRLYNFRPGYGYAWPPDPFYYQNHAKDDGVFLIDMLSGKAKLILSLDEIWEFCGAAFFEKDQKMIINHITFNPDASRFLALVRNFPPKGQRHDTAIITANRDGSDLFLLSDFAVQSHYWWLDNERVIFYSSGRELNCTRGWANNYILKDKTYAGSSFADGYFTFDNHMSFSPNGNYMLTDTYPEDGTHSKIMLYHTEKNVATDIGYFYNMPNVVTDVRCDLHPRWNRSGTAITFDSTHENFRGIYQIQIPDDADETLFN